MGDLTFDDEQTADPWRRFGIRPLPSMSARVHVDNAPPIIMDIVDERAAKLERPFLGVTTNGLLRPVARSLDGPQVSTQPIREAAVAFLQALTPDQRKRTGFAMDATEWRTWINVHMNHFRHGLVLEELAQPVRDLALNIVRATLSARGFHHARSIMQLNQLLAELTGDHEAFGEWPYFISIFGSPEGDAPWGWQFDGHHLCLNTVVFDGRIVMTPAFMGAEPRPGDRQPPGLFPHPRWHRLTWLRVDELDVTGDAIDAQFFSKVTGNPKHDGIFRMDDPHRVASTRPAYRIGDDGLEQGTPEPESTVPVIDQNACNILRAGQPIVAVVQRCTDDLSLVVGKE
jgi:Protein of unknown function (DUF3500)